MPGPHRLALLLIAAVLAPACGDERPAAPEGAATQSAGAAPALAAAAPAGPAPAAADPAAGCRGCHQGALSLAGRDADALTAAIRAIRDGRKAHPPAGLGDADDEAVAKLAEALSRP